MRISDKPVMFPGVGMYTHMHLEGFLVVCLTEVS